MSLPVIGWKERGTLPDWGISDLRMKLDTGARTSAIGVRRIQVVDTHALDGQRLEVLRLVIPLSRVHRERTVTVTTPVVGYKRVRDTGARAERRPVVRTRLMLGPVDHQIDITVTDRSGMIFRMILGRQALAGHATVDPQREFTLGRIRPAGRPTA